MGGSLDIFELLIESMFIWSTTSGDKERAKLFQVVDNGNYLTISRIKKRIKELKLPLSNGEFKRDAFGRWFLSEIKRDFVKNEIIY